MMLHVPFQCISPKLQSPIEPLKNPGLPNENQTHLKQKTTVGPRSSKFKVFLPFKKFPKSQRIKGVLQPSNFCQPCRWPCSYWKPRVDLGRSLGSETKARFMPQPCNVNGSRRTMQLHDGIREPKGAEVTHVERWWLLLAYNRCIVYMYTLNIRIIHWHVRENFKYRNRYHKPYQETWANSPLYHTPSSGVTPPLQFSFNKQDLWIRGWY